MIYLLGAKPKFGSHAIFAIVSLYFAVYAYVFLGISLTPLMWVDCCKSETWRN